MSNKHMKNNEVNYNRAKKTVPNVATNTNSKHPRKKHKFLKRFILFVLAILIILAGVFTWKIYQNGGGLKGVLTTVVGSDSKKQLSEIRFLLLGESGGLTDTIMICSYNPNTQKANVVSVQRDTFIGKDVNSAKPEDKINSLYNLNSKDPIPTLKAVNKITGLNLEYYIVVDTDALTELVDAIGGVDFEVPIDMNYHDTSKENFLTIELKKGMQKINGNKAEQLLRFRHNDDGTTYPSSYGEQDLGRMRTQREFITATLKQTLKPSNILNLGKILDITAKNIKTNLSISLVKDYIPYAVEFNTENLSTDVLPGNSIKPAKTYVYVLEEEKSQNLISTLFFDGTTEESINTNMPNLQILNASGNPELLEKVVNKYKEKGYNILMVGNSSKEASKSSIINRTNQSSEISNSVKSLLGYGSVTDGKKLKNIDFSITIGKDYK